jgi:hypothetical protein
MGTSLMLEVLWIIGSLFGLLFWLALGQDQA